MAVSWRLRTFLSKKHNIHSATQLQKKIIKETGIIISLQNLCNYMNKKPKMLRFSTIEVLCTALNCDLNNFCNVTPSQKKKDNRKLSYKNTPLSKRVIDNFPNPEDYK